MLPPVSKLTPAQAMYHFISGYTAKVAGTEMGVTEPQATFSPCFGGPFLVWHPAKYAELLAAKMQQHKAAGLAGQHRLERRRATASAADEAEAHAGDHRRHPHRRAGRGADGARPGLRLRRRRPTAPACPHEILMPRNTWADKAAYDATAKKLAGLFREELQEVRRRPPGRELSNAGPAA